MSVELEAPQGPVSDLVAEVFGKGCILVSAGYGEEKVVVPVGKMGNSDWTFVIERAEGAPEGQGWERVYLRASRLVGEEAAQS